MAENYEIFHSQYSAEQLELAKQNQVPRINPTTQCWERWDIATMQWVDTGIRAAGSLSTDVNGLLKGEDGIVVQAVAGVDYPTVDQVNAKYTKPAGGIPDSDIAGISGSKVSGAVAEANSVALSDGYKMVMSWDGYNYMAFMSNGSNTRNIATQIGVYALYSLQGGSNNNPVLRNEGLAASDTVPTNNGDIIWTYE